MWTKAPKNSRREHQEWRDLFILIHFCTEKCHRMEMCEKAQRTLWKGALIYSS